jgi:hypothetical protein
MKCLCIVPKAHHSKTAWGNAPGSLKRQTLALKARFMAGQAYHLDESRFQRLVLGQSKSWGDAPGWP